MEKRIPDHRAAVGALLHGGSTGGWEALALQIYNPTSSAGRGRTVPTPSVLRRGRNHIYKDTNASTSRSRVASHPEREFARDQRARSARHPSSALHGAGQGTRGRSGQQLDIWFAVCGAAGERGYFKPLFDKSTVQSTGASPSTGGESRPPLLPATQRRRREQARGQIHISTGDADTISRPGDARARGVDEEDQGSAYRDTSCTVTTSRTAGVTDHAGRAPEGEARHGMRHMPAGTTTPW